MRARAQERERERAFVRALCVASVFVCVPDGLHVCSLLVCSGPGNRNGRRTVWRWLAVV